MPACFGPRRRTTLASRDAIVIDSPRDVVTPKPDLVRASLDLVPHAGRAVASFFERNLRGAHRRFYPCGLLGTPL